MTKSPVFFLPDPAARQSGGPLLACGTAIDRFAIKKSLGSSGMEVLYAAEDRLHGQDITLKVVTAEPGGSKATRTLHREMSLCSRVRDHTHVIVVRDTHRIPWGYAVLECLSMEPVDGGRLSQLLQANRHDAGWRRSQGMEYFRQTCMGIAECHRCGVVHGHLHAGHILIASYHAKVSGLGIAARVHPGELPYGIPEEARWREGGRANPLSDIHSLGCLLLETLREDGDPPVSAVLRDLSEGDGHAIARILRNPSATETRVALRCLAADPAGRYQSVPELLSDFDGNPGAPPPNARRTRPAMAAQAGLEEARCEIEEGYPDDALQRCRRILVQEPEHEGAKALLDEAEEQRQRAGDLYPAIIQGLEARSLNETHALLHDALRVQRRHPLARLAQVKLAARARGYRLAVEKGVDAAKRHDLVAAIAWLRRARDLNPGDSDAEVALQYVEGLHGRVAGAQQRIEEAVDAGEWSRALALAEDILHDARAASLAIQQPKGGR